MVRIAEKLGKKRFISNIASLVGASLGCNGGTIDGIIGEAVFGAGSDILLTKLYPPKKSPPKRFPPEKKY